MANRVIAQIIKAGKEYKMGDTTITALQPSSMDLYSGELSIPIFKQLLVARTIGTSTATN